MRALYEDEQLVVVVKTKRLLACPVANGGASVVHALAACHAPASLTPAHRLDVGTFGVLAVCKAQAGRAHAQRQLSWRRALKMYAHLASAIEAAASPASFCVASLALAVGCNSVLAVVTRLVLGRTHQIRASQRRVWGDATYATRCLLFGAFRATCSALKRQALSACTLQVGHPVVLKLVGLEHKPDTYFRYALVNLLQLSARVARCARFKPNKLASCAFDAVSTHF